MRAMSQLIGDDSLTRRDDVLEKKKGIRTDDKTFGVLYSMVSYDMEREVMEYGI